MNNLMTEPNVSIVILNYNGYEDTIECLASLLKVDYPDFQIVLVDNGSVNQSVKEIRQWARGHEELLVKRKFIILENKENSGFARGNNLGIRYALSHFNSEYILVLNNDTVVEPDFIGPLIGVFAAHPRAALVAPKVREKIRRWQGHLFKRVNFLTYLLFFTPLRRIIWRTPFAVEHYLDKYSMPIKLYAVAGCCLLFKAEHLKKIGLFDERTFLGWEEYIIAEKLVKLGLETYLAPKSVIHHKIAQAINKLSKTRNRAYYLNGEKVFQEYYFTMPIWQRRIIKMIREMCYIIDRAS